MKKEYTPFGKYFSKLRKKNKQSMKEAADLLGVSISYISAVEHGDRDVPRLWIDKLIDIYKLSQEESNKLKEAYNNTSKNLKISIEEIEKALSNLLLNMKSNGSNIINVEEATKSFLNTLRDKADK